MTSRYTSGQASGSLDDSRLTGQQMPDTPASGADTAYSAPVPLLEVSDLLDAELRLRLAAYREGWQAAEQAHADDYQRGLVDGALGRKRAQHELVEMARLDALRWGPGGGERFGEPQAGDFTGGPEAVERVRQAWLRAGLSLGPGPGWIHLGGRYVHHNGAYGTARCTAACYAYKPGWYRIADAIAIIETLPGDHSDALVELRSQVRGGAAA